MLGTAPGQPVLLAECVVDARLGRRGREEICALPAHLAAEACAVVLQLRIEGRAPERPGGVQLAIRPWHGVVQAERFLDAIVQPGVVAIETREAADIDGP